jgi:hypothetical protein
MQKREKILAAVVAGMILLFIGQWIVRGIYGAFQEQAKRHITLAKQLKDKENMRRRGLEAQVQLEEWQERSLPSDLSAARSIYQNWLVSLVDRPDVKFEGAQFDSVRPISRKGIYHKLPFTVRGRGTLDQLTAFLFHFYRAGHLHKITRLTATPIEGTRQLDLLIAVEALSLPDAKHTDKLADVPSDRLKLKDLAEYRKAIVERNLYDYNDAPEISRLGERRVARTRPLEFSIRGRDPDGGKLKYELVSGPPGATLSQSGTFHWTPSAAQELAKYDVVVKVTDDGIPPRSATASFAIEVEEAPPPPVAQPPRRRTFDHAQFAVLSAIIREGEQPEAWIDIRTLGQIIELHESQEAKIGDLTFTVTRIDVTRQELVIKTGDKIRRVKLGESLGRAVLEVQTSSPDAF